MKAAEFFNTLLAALTDDDFFFDGEDRWGQTELFQQSLAQVFVAYRDILLKNELKLRAMDRGRATHALSSDEFLTKHGIAPWSFVNDAMTTAQLDFEIDHPDLDDYIPYHPRLTKRSTGARIFFSDLSSGEKVLMSLALSLYQASDTRQLTIYPKILLLDEIDAPLHPSMSKYYLEIVTKTIVEKNNIHVIATTHSPSTVALAPVESIYVVGPGSTGLRKTTKSQALNILTQGVPTLAITFEGRRQIFVESQNDAQLYDELCQTLKSALASERSLEFVGTGLRKAQTGDVNTGCDVVRHLVETLSKAGNKAVYGLIDWDGKNNPNDRVVVLAERRRNGVENLILDPLLLAAFIVGYDRNAASSLGIASQTGYPSFLDLTPIELQPIIDQVQTMVLGRAPNKKVYCKYFGGFDLDIDDEYLKMDDHKLETAVLAAFRGLNLYSKNRSGPLMLKIAQTVARDKPAFIPIELSEALLQLLNKDSH